MGNKNALSHYGVLGMHWGKHKVQPVRVHSADHIERNALYNKHVSEMSNDEIMKLTRRINLEKQVRDIHPSAYKKGMNIVKDITAAGVTVGALYGLSQTPLAGKIVGNRVVKGVAKKVVQSPLGKSIAEAVAKQLAKAAARAV